MLECRSILAADGPQRTPALALCAAFEDAPSPLKRLCSIIVCVCCVPTPASTTGRGAPFQRAIEHQLISLRVVNRYKKPGVQCARYLQLTVQSSEAFDVDSDPRSEVLKRKAM